MINKTCVREQPPPCSRTNRAVVFQEGARSWPHSQGPGAHCAEPVDCLPELRLRQEKLCVPPGLLQHLLLTPGLTQHPWSHTSSKRSSPRPAPAFLSDARTEQHG